MQWTFQCIFRSIGVHYHAVIRLNFKTVLMKHPVVLSYKLTNNHRKMSRINWPEVYLIPIINSVFRMCLKYESIKWLYQNADYSWSNYSWILLSISLTKHTGHQQSINLYFKIFNYPIGIKILLIYFLCGPKLGFIFSVR
jgi:hypothetical protein